MSESVVHWFNWQLNYQSLYPAIDFKSYCSFENKIFRHRQNGAILPVTFSNVFTGMKIFQFSLRFDYNLFLWDKFVKESVSVQAWGYTWFTMSVWMSICHFVSPIWQIHLKFAMVITHDMKDVSWRCLTFVFNKISKSEYLMNSWNNEILLDSVGYGNTFLWESYLCFLPAHYDDLIMTEMASHITSLTIVCSTFHAQMKENIKAPRHWPLWGEFTGDRWIPRTKGQ